MINKIIKGNFQKKKIKSEIDEFDFIELDKKIKKIDSIKIINLIMSYVDYRDNNKMLKYVSRNISIWKLCLLVVKNYVSSKQISEKELIANINCSVMTANTYIKELVEIGILYQEPDPFDKRKKNILPSNIFINEMANFIEYLKKKINEVGI